jgi:hypothetical protein
VFLANVGVNSSHRLKSPLFGDGSFEFIPIPEERALNGPLVLPTYGDLRCYNTDEPLLRFVGPHLVKAYERRLVHYDPNLNNPNDGPIAAWTYGDIPFASGRGASLRHARPGDWLLFLASLVPYRNGSYCSDRGFLYLIGYLNVERVLIHDVENGMLRDIVTGAACPLDHCRCNMHVLRSLYLPDIYRSERFMMFNGDCLSRRFARAVPLDRELCDACLRDAGGYPFDYRRYRSLNACLGVYTRSVRCWFDLGRADDQERFTTLLATVRKWNTDLPAGCAQD